MSKNTRWTPGVLITSLIIRILESSYDRKADTYNMIGKMMQYTVAQHTRQYEKFSPVANSRVRKGQLESQLKLATV